MPPQVQTVLGPVAPEALGVVDMHEHVRFGMPGWETEAGDLFARDAMLAETVRRFAAFGAAGGRTIVDVTGIGLGRDVAFYQDVARDAGVQLVACTGFWAQRGILPRYQHWYDIDAFEELFVRELTVGIGDSGVRAGVIKVGNSREGITPVEERTYRAAARAARRTGAAVVTHGMPWGEEQFRILREEGLDAERIVISHLDDPTALDFERDKRLAAQGAFIAYDHIGYEPESSPMHYAMPDARRVELVQAILAAGYERHLVLACDSKGWSLDLPFQPTPSHGCAWLLEQFWPRLLAAGVPESAFQTIMVETPRRILPF
ncbi:MAG TPA: phosphotriesterase [Chloroflexota bacterium]|jgi:phosphotriesterase-related protein